MHEAFRPVKCRNDHAYCIPCLATWYMMREQGYTSKMISRLTDKARERCFDELLKSEKRCPVCTVVGKFQRLPTHTTPTATVPTVMMLQVKCVLVDEVGRRCLWTGTCDKFGGHSHFYCQPPQPAKRKIECSAGRPNMTNVIITSAAALVSQFVCMSVCSFLAVLR